MQLRALIKSKDFYGKINLKSLIIITYQLVFVTIFICPQF